KGDGDVEVERGDHMADDTAGLLHRRDRGQTVAENLAGPAEQILWRTLFEGLVEGSQCGLGQSGHGSGAVGEMVSSWEFMPSEAEGEVPAGRSRPVTASASGYCRRDRRCNDRSGAGTAWVAETSTTDFADVPGAGPRGSSPCCRGRHLIAQNGSHHHRICRPL